MTLSARQNQERDPFASSGAGVCARTPRPWAPRGRARPGQRSAQVDLHLQPAARRGAGRAACGWGRGGLTGGAGGAGGEESANFQFEGIVGSSRGLGRMPHLSAAPAPALGSRPRVHRARHSALVRLARRRPGHHGECRRSGRRRRPGGARSEGHLQDRAGRVPPRGSCRVLPESPAGDRSAPVAPPRGRCGRAGPQECLPGTTAATGAAASFIRPTFAEHLICARHGARRWGHRGDRVGAWLWGSHSRREVWLEGDV